MIAYWFQYVCCSLSRWLSQCYRCDTAEFCFLSKGVDDNGSGLAAMLEAATQVSDAIRGGTKMTNTIIFVAFDAAVYNGTYMLIGS